MKALAVLSLTLLLTACMSHDAQKAEHILKLFHCKGIEPSQMQHNSVTQYYEHSLYIEQYKNGEESFEISLSEIVNQQYELYKSACQNLGGIPAKESS